MSPALWLSDNMLCMFEVNFPFSNKIFSPAFHTPCDISLDIWLLLSYTACHSFDMYFEYLNILCTVKTAYAHIMMYTIGMRNGFIQVEEFVFFLALLPRSHNYDTRFISLNYHFFWFNAHRYARN